MNHWKLKIQVSVLKWTAMRFQRLRKFISKINKKYIISFRNLPFQDHHCKSISSQIDTKHPWIKRIRVCSIDWLIDWLIDYIVFYAVSAIFRPYNGGTISWNQVSINQSIKKLLISIQCLLILRAAETCICRWDVMYHIFYKYTIVTYANFIYRNIYFFQILLCLCEL